mmetsp:Transcript_15803/g.39280  ORF Transcript_15803/g.39280 Transcript_15803/m.39280 type:complete len:298 (+) Transcript_15803:193-1086(+)
MGVMLNIHNLRRCFETDVIASLVATSSVIGLLQIADITHSYPTDDLKQAFLPNDVVNLILGVPMLLVSAFDSYLLPGALLYQVYSALTYVLALKDTQLGAVFFLQCTILIGCCVFLADAYAAAVKKIAVHRHHNSTISKKDEKKKSFNATSSSTAEKTGGGFLLLWGSLFMARSLYRLLISTEGESYRSASRASSERATDLADIILGVTWILGGLEALGGLQLVRYSNIALGQALLFQGSMLFIALTMLLAIKPFIVPDETFQIADIAVVGSMGMSVFIPFYIINQGLRDADRIKVA